MSDKEAQEHLARMAEEYLDRVFDPTRRRDGFHHTPPDTLPPDDDEGPGAETGED